MYIHTYIHTHAHTHTHTHIHTHTHTYTAFPVVLSFMVTSLIILADTRKMVKTDVDFFPRILLYNNLKQNV